MVLSLMVSLMALEFESFGLTIVLEGQLMTIRKTTLAKLACQNGGTYSNEVIQREAMRMHSER